VTLCEEEPGLHNLSSLPKENLLAEEQAEERRRSRLVLSCFELRISDLPLNNCFPTIIVKGLHLRQSEWSGGCMAHATRMAPYSPKFYF